MNNRVAIIRCEQYNLEEVYQALSEAVDATGDFNVQGKRVLLKPNIVSDSHPDKAITTHPVFLEAAIRLAKERGAARIMVGESPGLHTSSFYGKHSGIGEVCRRTGVEWRDFLAGKAELPCPQGKAVKSVTVTDAIRDADVLISLPKLKTHQLMLFTGAMKNCFGLIPSMMKSASHVRFPRIGDFAAFLVDIVLAAKPGYALMDGIVGMEGPGPGSGTPRQLSLVLASSNLLAMDIAASAIVGYPPLEVPMNREALSRQVWLKNLEEVEYPLLSPEAVAVPDWEKIPLKKEGRQLLEMALPRSYRKFRERLTPRPVVNQEVCRRCGDCVRICASRALTLKGDGKDQRIHLDYTACIRCYCCHEICPYHAIDIQKVPLGTALFGS